MSYYSKKPEGFHEADEDFSDFDFDKASTWEDEPWTQAEIDDVLSVFDEPAPTHPPSVNDDSPDWSNKVTKANAKSVSNKVTRRFRRSDRVDREALKKIQKFGLGTVLSGVGTVSNFQPTSTPTNTNDNTSALPHWTHTGPRIKLTMANRAVADFGHAFSLNLGPQRLQEALASRAGFSDCMARYINRALKRRFGRVPLFWFQVDVTKRGKLHLHGAIESTSDELPRIMEALNEAGGKGWVPSRRGEQQCWFEVQDKPDGWVHYALEDRAKVRFYLKGGRSHFIAKGLRRSAKVVYEEYRSRTMAEMPEVRHN